MGAYIGSLLPLYRRYIEATDVVELFETFWDTLVVRPPPSNIEDLVYGVGVKIIYYLCPNRSGGS